MIRTDMISCCILFIRLDENDKPLKKTIINKKLTEEINTDYIEKVELTDEIKSKNIIYIADLKIKMVNWKYLDILKIKGD